MADLATKCLRVESMRVYDALRTDGVDAGRRAVSMIVGRDTSVLDVAGVTRAAVETIAENTSDGVIAPMLYTAIGGPVLGFVYKAVNTMDSMLGYKMINICILADLRQGLMMWSISYRQESVHI